MKFYAAIILLTSVVLMTGCMGEHAGFKESMSDSFFSSPARTLPANEKTCFVLTKKISFKAGTPTYTLPAGLYLAHKMNKNGYFYHSPETIESSRPFFFPDQNGIYIDNTHKHGNLFATLTAMDSPAGGYITTSPSRGPALPSDVFSYIKFQSKC